MNSLSQWWQDFSRRWLLDASISAEQLSAYQSALWLRRVAHAWVARRDSVFKTLLKERKSLEAKCWKAAAELSEAVTAIRRFGFRRDYYPAIDARDVSFMNRRELRARAIKPSRTAQGARAVLDWCDIWGGSAGRVRARPACCAARPEHRSGCRTLVSLSQVRTLVLRPAGRRQSQ